MSLVEKALRKAQEARPLRPEPVPLAPAPLPVGGAGTGDTAPFKALKLKKDIDFAGLRAAGILPSEHERRTFSRIYRGIKRPILAQAALRGQDPEHADANLVMVASAVPGDGKTFTAMNLALSMALERDRQVVLVDGDVVKHELSSRLGLDGMPGLLDALKDELTPVDEYLIQTDLPNLALLGAGTGSIHSTEFMSSLRMRTLMAQLGALRDCLVIFDSSPLLLTTEARAIAEVCGQVVVVVREGITPQSTLAEALALVQSRPSVSLILNQSMASPNRGYEYGYADNPNPAVTES